MGSLAKIVIIIAGVVLFLFFALLGSAFALPYFIANNYKDELESGGGAGDAIATTACGTGIETLLAGYKMLPALEGKLGHEEHLDNTEPSHYCGKDSGNCSAVVHTGFVNPHSTEQERWYFNTQWGGWLNDGNDFDTKKGSAQARKLAHHAKVILVNPANGKALVASGEEFGPGMRVVRRDGIWYGAPPEVYHYLGTGDPYTGNPDDKKGQIKVMFAQDQSVKIGPCIADTPASTSGETKPSRALK